LRKELYDKIEGNMKRLFNFVFYNNGFVLLMLAVFLSSGTAMAANDNVRGALISSEEAVVAIDNSYIIKVNLSTFDFKVKITAVEKDDLNYYVSYDLYTIELVDDVWQKVVKKDVLQINKGQLDGRDVGLYATEELNELLQSTIQKLKEVQEIEKTLGESDKVIERRYKGLVGRFMDSDEVTFRGYNPIIKPPVIVVVKTPEPEFPEEVEEVDLDDVLPEEDTDDDTASTTPSEETPIPDVTSPDLRLIGDALTVLEMSQTYIEVGATAVDDIDGDITSTVIVSGQVDTATIGEYTITYSVTDQAGNTSTIDRKVQVIEVPVVEEPPVEEVPTEPPIVEPPAVPAAQPL